MYMLVPLSAPPPGPLVVSLLYKAPASARPPHA
nr:MAG TPA: hypothetical protein [Caudoviricetes sp.]